MLIDSTALAVGLLVMAVIGATVTYIIRTCMFEIKELDKEKTRVEAAKSVSESTAANLAEGPQKAYARIPRTEAGSIQQRLTAEGET